MAAIHPPRLKKQVSELVLAYAEPELFQRKLRDLFDFYGDLTRRTSKQSRKPTGLPSMNVPPPVIRQVVMQLTPYAETAPQAVLALARTLWAVPQLEHRQLAAQLVGKIPVDDAQQVLTLVTVWCMQNFEESVLDSMAVHSLTRLQKENPALLLDSIQDWMDPPKPEQSEDEEDIAERQDRPPLLPGNQIAYLNLQKLALTALPPLVQSPQFENLPRIYSLLDRVLQDAPKTLRPYILDVLRPLAKRAPQEVAYILKQQLSEHPSAHIKWLARRVYTSLPEEFHAGLYPLIFDKGQDDT
ncbi:MAG TPA: DNA alkylation repair protein [Anaerolineales bacterium]|nr:DNA alkylation repair protein [Anaerolineales bacterium]